MIRKSFLAVLILALSAIAAHSASHEKPAVAPAEEKSSAPGGASYFEGTWTGGFAAYRDQSKVQDVTIKIEKGKKEGFFAVEYSWGAVNYPTVTVPAGSLKARGRQEGDKFFIGWKDKQGKENTMILEKHKENVVKAKQELTAEAGTGVRPYKEAYLDRK